MDGRDFEKLIGDDFDLPAAPLVALRVLDVTADENSSAKDLVKVIAPDGGITSRILKVANSSFYGRTSEISTLVLAVTTMGFDAVRNLVIAESTRAVFSSFGDEERALWAHSVGTGIAALHVAKATRRASLDESFTAGLLHDVGRAVMLGQRRDDFLGILDAVKGGADDVLEAETAAVGFPHTEVGAALLAKWKLPEPLVAVAWLHHNSQALGLAEEPVRSLVATAAAANGVSHILGIGGRAGEAPASAVAALGFVGLSEDDLPDLVEKTRETCEKEPHLFA